MMRQHFFCQSLLTVVAILAFGGLTSENVNADVLFDMVPEPTDFMRDPGNPEHSGTLTRDGIEALFTAQGNDGLEVPLGDLVFDTDSFGMSIVDGINNESLIDVSQSDSFGDIHEQIVVTFDQQVQVSEIVLDFLGNGDEAVLSWNTGSVSLFGGGTLRDAFDLNSTNAILNSGDELTLRHVSGGGFSFKSFSVSAVPEPSGLMALVFTGVALGLRRQRRR